MISDRYGGEMGNVVKANTREKVPSDGLKREPEGCSLQQNNLYGPSRLILSFTYLSIIQPQIRKSWDSMENANKKRK